VFNPLGGMSFGPQEIQQLQQQLLQQQQNLQNLQQMLQLQSEQINPTTIQAMILQNQRGLLQQGLLSLQNFGSPSLSLPQMVAKQLNHLQESQQILQQKPLLSEEHHEKARDSSSLSSRAKESVRPSKANHVVWTPSNTQKDRIDRTRQIFDAQRHLDSTSPVNAFNTSFNARKELDSIENQTTKIDGPTTPLTIQIPLRNRTSEPNPEEMTDLEELEQFAKMFKQRRIKLGKILSDISRLFA
jgi:class 2 POU domain transcription factor